MAPKVKKSITPGHLIETEASFKEPSGIQFKGSTIIMSFRFNPESMNLLSSKHKPTKHTKA
jgi:hypothetical protein